MGAFGGHQNPRAHAQRCEDVEMVALWRTLSVCAKKLHASHDMTSNSEREIERER